MNRVIFRVSQQRAFSTSLYQAIGSSYIDMNLIDTILQDKNQLMNEDYYD